MAGTFLFKNTTDNAHRTRYLTNEDDFSSGMKYTDAPLATGNAKAIVNFDFKNDGESLIPRGGLHTYAPAIATFNKSAIDIDYCVHHSASMYINNVDESDASLHNYTILGAITDTGFDISTAKLIVEVSGKYLVASYDITDSNAVIGVLLMKPAVTEIHDMKIATPKYRNGIYTSIEGNSYVLVNNSTENMLGTIKAKFNEDNTEVTWHIEKVEPDEVQPSKAINYGYNMFKDNPYSFENTVSSTGEVQMTGVVPYDESGKLLLTARPGTPIEFVLSYKYPQADVTNEDKYLIQWEIQDLNSNSDAEVLRKVRGSTEYTPGEKISYTITPSYTNFSLIVRLYKKSEIAEQDAAWEADTSLQALVTKDDYLTPNQVTTLASYYLTNNSNSSTLNVDAVAYDMGTATGMCTWQQRIVMWGVKNAKGTLFVSEINSPGYMPYPNNAEIYNDDIICAVPYLTNLLVFTKTSLYKITLSEDGLSYTSECVQERLNMEASDVNTVVVVQNMVYFKSGNYFYMVVPNTSSSKTDTQLAPVSRPVEYLFNDLHNIFDKLLSQVYNFPVDDASNTLSTELLDYSVALMNTRIVNTYKFEIKATNQLGTKTYVFDISINYDTVLRAWTMYIWQGTNYRITIYKPTVTGDPILTNIFDTDGKVTLELIQADSTDPKDDCNLSVTRTHGNYQYIDTGYRDFNEDFKKRFREIQFCVNAINNAKLKFNTSFIVDDATVVQMYKYVVNYCTDPNDTNYGTLFVERIPVEEYENPSITELDAWELNTSMFPDVTVNKIRYKVSGKGYNGSAQILSRNEVAFELLHINWVYRVMFAR